MGLTDRREVLACALLPACFCASARASSHCALQQQQSSSRPVQRIHSQSNVPPHKQEMTMGCITQQHHQTSLPHSLRFEGLIGMSGKLKRQA